LGKYEILLQFEIRKLHCKEREEIERFSPSAKRWTQGRGGNPGWKQVLRSSQAQSSSRSQQRNEAGSLIH
jgi:hypothetical protein